MSGPGRTLHLATEAIFVRDAAGHLWSPSLEWTTMPPGFDSVRFVARVIESEAAPAGAVAMDPTRMATAALPAYAGAGALMRRSGRIVPVLWRESAEVDVAVLRLPGPIGTAFGLCLMLRRKRFGVQLAGDIEGVFRGGDFALPVRVLGSVMTWLTRRLCRKAGVIAYVTRSTLQAGYPAAKSADQYVFANVALAAADFAEQPPAPRTTGPFHLVFCGHLAQRYKGLDVLIDALAQLRTGSVGLRLTVIGSGGYQAEFERRADDVGLADDIEFVGTLPRPEVLTRLAAADLFVMPSRTEGLPRALIEAMAQGIPCIASRVGGVPELLPDDAMVTPGDAAALASRIERFLADPALREAQGRKNLETARGYEQSHLEAERARFLDSLRALAS